MKLAFITNIYKEEEKKEVERVSGEIKNLGFKDYKIYVNDGIKNNRGYAYGINQGIRKGLKNGADVFVIFNADISIAGLTQKAILQGLDHFDIFGFALKQEGKIYYGGAIDKCRLSGGLIKTKPEKQYADVDFVSGSLMFVKREVIEKIGVWDESYFFYYDEVDYCLRAKKAGFKIGIDSRHFYQHFELSQYNPRKNYFLAKNRLKFFWKYSNLKQKIYEFFRSPKTLIENLPLIGITIKQSKFLTNFFSLNFSSLANKIFHFILFIFLVRNLPPEKYGIYTIVWAFIGFFTPLVDLGTTSYGLVYIPKQRGTMINKLISMRFFLAGLIFIGVNIVALFSFLNQKEMIVYIFLTSFVILANVWSGSYLIISSIKEKIINPSVLSLIFNIVLVLAIIGFYLIKRQLLTIFLIIFFLYLIYTAINYFFVKKEVIRLKLVVDLASWKKILSKSYIFVLISFLGGLYFKQDVFLLKFLKSEAEVGIYSSGYKFLDALLLLAASYNIIVMPIMSKLTNNLNILRRKIFKDIVLLSFFGILISVSFYFLAPIILPLVLKNSYAGGIETARIVVFALPFILLTSVYYNVLYAFDLAKFVILVLFIQVIVNCVLNIIFIPGYSYVASAYITVFSEVLNFLLTFYFVKRKIRQL